MASFELFNQVNVWDCKVWPTQATVERLLVWWGWAWGRSRYRAGWGWGAWWVVSCQCDTLPVGTSCCVVIWAWWKWCNTLYTWACQSWKNSCFWSHVAYWGWWGWGMCSCTIACTWAAGWSWWWGAWCTGGASWWAACSWQWNCGGKWCAWWWGGWWVCGAWTNATCLCCAWKWWNWASFHWISYGAWGWGWACNLSGTWWDCWWWDGWCYRTAWCPATSCWSGWWWGWYTTCSSCCFKWWDGADGIFAVAYPSSCPYCITWWCKYECNWYCIHCFTSNGTLTIN